MENGGRRCRQQNPRKFRPHTVITNVNIWRAAYPVWVISSEGGSVPGNLFVLQMLVLYEFNLSVIKRRSLMHLTALNLIIWCKYYASLRRNIQTFTDDSENCIITLT